MTKRTTSHESTPARVRLDGPHKDLFLAELRHRGNVTASCEAAGIGRRTAYEHRESDPEFAAAWDAALETAWDALETEAVRRATEGVQKPVYQRGELVGHVTEHSDYLMGILLKGNRPTKYGAKLQVEHAGGVTILQLPEKSEP